MITGQQGALAAQMTADIVAAIQAAFQNNIDPEQQKGIQALSTGISNALIPFWSETFKSILLGI